MTRTASSLDDRAAATHGAGRPDVARGRLKGAFAALGLVALVAACADASDRGGAPSGGTTATPQGAGVASGAVGGAAGGTVGGTGGGTGSAAGVATRPATTGGGDTGTPVTPDTTSKAPPTTR
jgi:hypothetical protein